MTPDDTRARCILLDPPWNERGAGKTKRGADRHYGLLKTRDIPGVVRGSGLWDPHPDAHVWMWCTNNRLPDGLWVLGELGVRYVTNAVWVKTADPERAPGARESGVARVRDLALQIGLGQYLRGSHELLLFGVMRGGRGQNTHTWKGRRDIPSVIRARRTRHSAKPAESYDMIESVSFGPRLEFFARSTRPGWQSWGDEAPEGESDG
jgi:N6-adenosine-specific RNA methylase IME4